MSGHHEQHPMNEQKPVSFTVPLILALVTILIIVLVLSVCDPKSGHDHAQENKAHTEQGHGDNKGTQHTTDETAPDAAGKTTGSEHH